MSKTADLRAFAKRMRKVPRTIAIDVARLGASKITTAAQTSFDAGRTAYDETRPLGTSGNRVSLVKGGKLRAMALRFLHDGGTRIRAVVMDRYMGVMIGRFGILPAGGQPLPTRWQQHLETATKEAGAERLNS